MRHGCKVNHLSRTHAHRVAMLSNMATSLIMHKRIETSIVFSYLHSKEAVNELFREVSQKVAQRPGGYTRILKTGIRHGDNSEMAIIELVDYNENMLKDTTKKAAKSTRRSRAKKAEAAPVAEAPVAEAPAEEAPKDE